MAKIDKVKGRQREFVLNDVELDARAARKAAIVATAGSLREKAEELLKLQGTPLFEKLYVFLQTLKLASPEELDAVDSRLRVCPEVGTLVRILGEGLHISCDDVIALGLKSLCTQYATEDIWDINKVSEQIEHITKSIQQIDNSISGLIEIVSIGTYANLSAGEKTTLTSAEVEKELESIQLPIREPVE